MSDAALPPILRAEGLSRHFGQGARAVKAVDDVTFELRRGEIASVVGESGSGKSTLARVVLRLLEPTSGGLYFDGEDVTRIRGFARRKAYWREVQAVFQDPFGSFNQFFPVRYVLRGALRLEGTRLPSKEREKRMWTALESVGLDPGSVLDQLPHELSGGQRQRVMIARALMIRPRLLIADEPTTMIDASSRANILNVLLDLHRDHQLTILFITHDISLATYVSDTLLIMQGGKLVERGPVERITREPEHPYTRQLFADTFSLHGEPWRPASGAVTP
jgi:peptide/nickel transport system ATP-binding protein